MFYRREQTKGKQIVTLRILWHQILLDIWHNGELFRRASWTNSHPFAGIDAAVVFKIFVGR